MTKRKLHIRRVHSLKVRAFFNKTIRLIEEHHLEKLGERYGYL